MKKLHKSLATAIACGVLLIGCSVTLVEASSESKRFVEIEDGLYRLVDCDTGVAVYKQKAYSTNISTQKLSDGKLANFGCKIQ